MKKKGVLVVLVIVAFLVFGFIGIVVGEESVPVGCSSVFNFDVKEGCNNNMCTTSNVIPPSATSLKCDLSGQYADEYSCSCNVFWESDCSCNDNAKGEENPIVSDSSVCSSSSFHWRTSKSRQEGDSYFSLFKADDINYPVNSSDCAEICDPDGNHTIVGGDFACNKIEKRSRETEAEWSHRCEYSYTCSSFYNLVKCERCLVVEVKDSNNEMKKVCSSFKSKNNFKTEETSKGIKTTMTSENTYSPCNPAECLEDLHCLAKTFDKRLGRARRPQCNKERKCVECINDVDCLALWGFEKSKCQPRDINKPELGGACIACREENNLDCFPWGSQNCDFGAYCKDWIVSGGPYDNECVCNKCSPEKCKDKKGDLPKCQKYECENDKCKIVDLCDNGQTCNTETGQCECTPDCSGKQCGDDDLCGGKCTNCPNGQTCNTETGQCDEDCTDTCGSLGFECGEHMICGKKVDCGPSTIPCTKSFGTCDVEGTKSCVSGENYGECNAEDPRNCQGIPGEGKACDDGCGGDCGGCPPNIKGCEEWECVNGYCSAKDICRLQNNDPNNKCIDWNCRLAGLLPSCAKTIVLCDKKGESCNPKTGECEKTCNNDASVCNDDIACTDDNCVDGYCGHSDNCDPGYACNRDTGKCETFFCTSPEDCDDGIACTDDSCEDNYQCAHKSNCKGKNEICIKDGLYKGECTCIPLTDPCVGLECGSAKDDCNNNVLCGVDDGQCQSGYHCENNQCLHNPCTINAQCDDDNPCTIDSCNPGTNTCINLPKCSPEKVCNTLTGECVNCKSNEDCNNGISCTDDSCVDGSCVHENNCPEEKSCNTNTGECVKTCNNPLVCDDEIACTDDNCVDGYCFNQDSCLNGKVCDRNTGKCKSKDSGTSSSGGGGGGSSGGSGGGGGGGGSTSTASTSTASTSTASTNTNTQTTTTTQSNNNPLVAKNTTPPVEPVDPLESLSPFEKKVLSLIEQIINGINNMNPFKSLTGKSIFDSEDVPKESGMAGHVVHCGNDVMCFEYHFENCLPAKYKPLLIKGFYNPDVVLEIVGERLGTCEVKVYKEVEDAGIFSINSLISKFRYKSCDYQNYSLGWNYIDDGDDCKKDVARFPNVQN